MRNKLGLDLHFAVTDDVIFGVTIVELRFEDLDTLSSDLCTSQTADEFFALAAEHASANNFDPAKVAALKLKLLCHNTPKRCVLYGFLHRR